MSLFVAHIRSFDIDGTEFGNDYIFDADDSRDAEAIAYELASSDNEELIGVEEAELFIAREGYVFELQLA